MAIASVSNDVISVDDYAELENHVDSLLRSSCKKPFVGSLPGGKHVTCTAFNATNVLTR